MGLFLVSDDHHHAILSGESLPQPFRLVDGAVLSSRASKRDHQVREFQSSIAAPWFVRRGARRLRQIAQRQEIVENIAEREGPVRLRSGIVPLFPDWAIHGSRKRILLHFLRDLEGFLIRGSRSYGDEPSTPWREVTRIVAEN